MADSRATGRGKSFGVLSYLGDSTVVPKTKIDHREYQPMDEVEEEITAPMDPQY